MRLKRIAHPRRAVIWHLVFWAFWLVRSTMHTARHVVNGIGMVLFHEDDAGTPGWLGRVALKDVWRDDREDDPKAHRFKVQMGFETGHQAVIYPGKCGVVLDLIQDVPEDVDQL